MIPTKDRCVDGGEHRLNGHDREAWCGKCGSLFWLTDEGKWHLHTIPSHFTDPDKEVTDENPEAD